MGNKNTGKIKLSAAEQLAKMKENDEGYCLLVLTKSRQTPEIDHILYHKIWPDNLFDYTQVPMPAIIAVMVDDSVSNKDACNNTHVMMSENPMLKCRFRTRPDDSSIFRYPGTNYPVVELNRLQRAMLLGEKLGGHSPSLEILLHLFEENGEPIPYLYV